ncbi:hypothetical protein AS593_03670 [Caulobacter vibrioides]|nr:hypothetical protein AS593_03670 [Caulobacter vibrioides]
MGQYRPDPNAILNTGSREVRVGTVTWPGKALSLHPGPQHERASARIRLPKAGVYVIVAEFRALDSYVKPIDVKISAGASVVWRSVSGERFAGAVRLAAGAALDFSVGVAPGDNYRDSSAALRMAVFRVTNAKEGGFKLVRVAGRTTGLSDAEAREWAQGVDPSTAREPGAACIPARAWVQAQAMRYLSAPMCGLMEASFGRSAEGLVDWVLGQSPATPTTDYVHVFVPRSGSTVLMEMMSKTGVMGFPHEYMEENLYIFLSIVRHMAGSDQSYTDFVKSRMRTDNGVFGAQIDIERFQYSSFDLTDKVIYQTRRNIVMQAVSLYFSSPAGADVPYSREAMLGIVAGLLRMMHDCEALFAQRGIEPVRVVYEDLLLAPTDTVIRLAEALGVELGPLAAFDLGALNWKVMRTGRNWEYGHRLVAEGGAMLGYDVVETEGGVVATLAGLPTEHLPPGDLFPVRFHAPDADALRSKLEAAAGEFLAEGFQGQAAAE